MSISSKTVLCKYFMIAVICCLLLVKWQCRSCDRAMASTEQISAKKSASRNAFNVHSIWIRKLHEKEFKIFSQDGEDGVLLWIFANIGTVNSPPRFVEFGTENGDECNTRFLRQQLGWEGLMMDGNHEIPSINLYKEQVTAENINQLLEKYQTPSLIDLLSIDLEYDFLLEFR